MKTIGKPPILVEKDKFCEECKTVHDFEKCPDCGAWIMPVPNAVGVTFWCDKGCGWSYSMVDDEYEFEDQPQNHCVVISLEGAV